MCFCGNEHESAAAVNREHLVLFVEARVDDTVIGTAKYFSLFISQTCCPSLCPGHKTNNIKQANAVWAVWSFIFPLKGNVLQASTMIGEALLDRNTATIILIVSYDVINIRN